jgi:hypothetical protein
VDYAVEAKAERISAELKSAVGASTDPHGRGPRRRSPTGRASNFGYWNMRVARGRLGSSGAAAAIWSLRREQHCWVADSHFPLSRNEPLSFPPVESFLLSVYSLVFSAVVGFQFCDWAEIVAYQTQRRRFCRTVLTEVLDCERLLFSLFGCSQFGPRCKLLSLRWFGTTL